jgi:hypothetical protein
MLYCMEFVFRRVRIVAISPVRFVMSVRPSSVRMYQRGFHWTDVCEI